MFNLFMKGGAYMKPLYKLGMFLRELSTKKSYRIVRVTKGIDDAGTKSYIPSYKYKLQRYSGSYYQKEKIDVWEHELNDLGFEFDKKKTEDIGTIDFLNSFFSVPNSS
mgnify:FL=1